MKFVIEYFYKNMPRNSKIWLKSEKKISGNVLGGLSTLCFYMRYKFALKEFFCDTRCIYVADL